MAAASCSRDGERYAVSSPREEIDHAHPAFTEVLGEFARGDGVDYAALKASPDGLENYLDILASVPEQAFDGWTEERRIAFLINLYNAATLKLVIDHYPVDGIKDIGGVFAGPWDQPVVRLFGERVTLDHVEHERLRPNYDEPRIHFAVNCASVGCPPLRAEAYRAADLDRQLDEQGRIFLRDRGKNRVDEDAGILYLSPLFDWFGEDFISESGGVRDFVAPYFPPEDRRVIENRDLRIEHTDWDWSLNDS